MRISVVVVLLAACGARSRAAELPKADGDLCGDEPWIAWEPRLDEIDLLLLVDNSNEMREEQSAFVASLPEVVGALAIPADDDRDGAPDWPAARSMHLGVISTDMGTSGYLITGCDDAERGDDGILRNLPAPGMKGCDVTYPTFLTFDSTMGDLSGVASDFACIATLGSGGCRLEQPLAAVEKALTIHAASGAPNDGFLRESAVLSILIATEEEDCSVSDARIFSADDSLGSLPLRCYFHQEFLRPVDDLVTSILAVKLGHPNRIAVAAVVGIPPEFAALSDARVSADLMTVEDFQSILDDTRMAYTMDYSPEGGGNSIVPTCSVPGIGTAFPPRRIVEFVRDLDAEGSDGIVQSICRADWSGTVRAITRNIGRTMRAGCLAQPLTGPDGDPLATGEHADCVLVERLADDGSCQPSRIDRGLEEGRRVCQLCQQGDGEALFETDFRGESVAACPLPGPLWFYTTGDPDCGDRGKIEISTGDQFPPGSTLRLECARSALPEPEDC